MALIKSIFAASIAILGAAYALFYIYIAPISNAIIVGFDGFHGSSILGTGTDVFAILAAGSALIFINLGLSAALAAKDRFFASLLPFGSLFIAILILISVGVIVSVN